MSDNDINSDSSDKNNTNIEEFNSESHELPPDLTDCTSEEPGVSAIESASPKIIRMKDLPIFQGKPLKDFVRYECSIDKKTNKPVDYAHDKDKNSVHPPLTENSTIPLYVSSKSIKSSFCDVEKIKSDCDIVFCTTTANLSLESDSSQNITATDVSDSESESLSDSTNFLANDKSRNVCSSLTINNSLDGVSVRAETFDFSQKTLSITKDPITKSSNRFSSALSLNSNSEGLARTPVIVEFKSVISTDSEFRTSKTRERITSSTVNDNQLKQSQERLKLEKLQEGIKVLTEPEECHINNIILQQKNEIKPLTIGTIGSTFQEKVKILKEPDKCHTKNILQRNNESTRLKIGPYSTNSSQTLCSAKDVSIPPVDFMKPNTDEGFPKSQDFLKPIKEEDFLKVNTDDFLKLNAEEDFLKLNAEEVFLKPNDEDFLKPNADEDFLKLNADEDFLKPNADADLPSTSRNTRFSSKMTSNREITMSSATASSYPVSPKQRSISTSNTSITTCFPLDLICPPLDLGCALDLGSPPLESSCLGTDLISRPTTSAAESRSQEYVVKKGNFTMRYEGENSRRENRGSDNRNKDVDPSLIQRFVLTPIGLVRQFDSESERLQFESRAGSLTFGNDDTDQARESDSNNRIVFQRHKKK